MANKRIKPAAAPIITSGVNELRVQRIFQLLDSAVQLWIARLRALDAVTFAARWTDWTNAELLDAAGVFSEVLPAGGGTPGEGARAFHALAHSIAALAFVSGRVHFGELHYEAQRDPAPTEAQP